MSARQLKEDEAYPRTQCGFCKQGVLLTGPWPGTILRKHQDKSIKDFLICYGSGTPIEIHLK
jgi:hypothetical protein